MASALTPPFLAAALVLCAAGVAKLRSPAGAERALATIGMHHGSLTSRLSAVRLLAVAELALGAACLSDPSPPTAAALAAVYAAFAAVGVLLARERAECGCFGDAGAPASGIQTALSAASALVAIAVAATGRTHGIAWVFDRPAGQALTLAIGIAGGAYAIVVAYTDLPQAWAAWSGP